MSATETFKFMHFTLRPAGVIATDQVLARDWTFADPDHCGRVRPSFWVEQDFGKDSYLLFDREGPVFFWKGILLVEPRRVEMHIQFPPMPKNLHEKLQRLMRTRAGLIHGLAWLEGLLSKASVEEIYFDSLSRPLIAFATKRLGFVQEGQRISKRLLPLPECQQAYTNETKAQERRV